MFLPFLRSALIAVSLPALLALTACGGGGGDSDTPSASTGGSAGGSAGAGSGGSASGGNGSGGGSAKFYRRTDNETALALDGGSSYFCSWGDCPGGATCGVKILGVDQGDHVDWQIPTTANGGNKLKTTFDILRNGSGLTFLYQGNRAGDYVPVSSWAEATKGDRGYCGGSGDAGGGSGNSGSSGSGGAGSSTTGQIAVYTRRSSLPSGVAVTIDGQAAGTITQYFSSTPNCGDAGTVTKTLTAGSHAISAKAGNLSWGPGTFIISAGACLTYELQ